LSFVDSIKSGFRNYVTFRGRASRSEYWWWTLFAFLVQAVTAGVDDTFNLIATLGLFLPGLAVNVRRLHDTNRRGWWLVWPIVAIVVAVVSFLLFVGTAALDLANADEWDLEGSLNGAPVIFILIAGAALVVALGLGIANLVFTLLKSDPQMNRFGPPPPPKSLADA
jgi:uncharacterized membrane protein YhaH (DUF805 family)